MYTSNISQFTLVHYFTVCKLNYVNIPLLLCSLSLCVFVACMCAHITVHICVSACRYVCIWIQAGVGVCMVVHKPNFQTKTFVVSLCIEWGTISVASCKATNIGYKLLIDILIAYLHGWLQNFSELYVHIHKSTASYKYVNSLHYKICNTSTDPCIQKFLC